MNRPLKLIKREIAKKRPLKHVFGIPVSFDSKKIFWNLWDPSRDEVFLAKHWGIGWDVNLYGIVKKTRRLLNI